MGRRSSRSRPDRPHAKDNGFTAIAWLIDALRVQDLSSLAAVFTSRTIIKVIHNAKFERRILAKEGLEIAAVFDTLEWA